MAQKGDTVAIVGLEEVATTQRNLTPDNTAVTQANRGVLESHKIISFSIIIIITIWYPFAPSPLLQSLPIPSLVPYFFNRLSPPITPNPFPFLSPPITPNRPPCPPHPYSGVEPERRSMMLLLVMAVVVVLVGAGSKVAARRMRASKLTRLTGRGERISETRDYGLLVGRIDGGGRDETRRDLRMR